MKFRLETQGLGLALMTGFLLFLISALVSCQSLIGSGDEESSGFESLPLEDWLLEEEPMETKEFLAPVSGWDSGQRVLLQRSNGTVESLSMEAYLWGVVAAEMPASFPLEALKAQTVAARTYTMLRLEYPSSKHGLGMVCDDSACCQAYIDVSTRVESWGAEAVLYQEKIARSVAETDGLFVLYQGGLIDAVFFSSSAGQTLTALEVWGSDLPYLQSVGSFEGADVPNYETVVTYTLEELRALLEGAYPLVDLTEDGTAWFLEPVYQSGGAVGQYLVGGVTLTGLQLRALLGLRSTVFTVAYGEKEGFVFSVCGYGHGVGMSQYGAKAMAEEGSHFDEILTWYYQGTTVEGYGDDA